MRSTDSSPPASSQSVAAPAEGRDERAPAPAAEADAAGSPDGHHGKGARTRAGNGTAEGPSATPKPKSRPILELVLSTWSERVAPARGPARRDAARTVGDLPFEELEEQALRRLTRWVVACGLATLSLAISVTVDMFRSEVRFAHVVVGTLTLSTSGWLLLAGFRFGQVLRSAGRDQHHLIHGLGLLQSAFLLKALVVFAGMSTGCFLFSVLASLLVD